MPCKPATVTALRRICPFSGIAKFSDGRTYSYTLVGGGYRFGCQRTTRGGNPGTYSFKPSAARLAALANALAAAEAAPAAGIGRRLSFGWFAAPARIAAAAAAFLAASAFPAAAAPGLYESAALAYRTNPGALALGLFETALLAGLALFAAGCFLAAAWEAGATARARRRREAARAARYRRRERQAAAFRRACEAERGTFLARVGRR